ncbi:MAG: LysR family transcriptional regulator [Candidatus Caenarcaniphilales bacterium]|nr:LysR family transcriptional regulator [Candidatus Caenarcaniphilales bacterium]
MENLISLEIILVLDAIDRKRSYAQAAEELHKVPSAITYTVQKYERELDLKLINRKGYRAELTEAGKTFLEEGRQVLEAVKCMVEKTKQVQVGWEREIKIAYDTIFQIDRLLPLVKKFYKSCQAPIKVQLLEEVLGGTWDSIYSGRADLVIGASGQVLQSGRLKYKQIGEVDFVFVVAPNHPLAKSKEPLQDEEIEKHIAVVASDSSRTLAARTSGLLSRQTTIKVPTIKDKIKAQVLGIGVGYLPKHLIWQELKNGELIVKEVEKNKQSSPLYLVWDSHNRGRALKWFLDELEQFTI